MIPCVARLITGVPFEAMMYARPPSGVMPTSLGNGGATVMLPRRAFVAVSITDTHGGLPEVLNGNVATYNRAPFGVVSRPSPMLPVEIVAMTVFDAVSITFTNRFHRRSRTHACHPD